MFYIADMEYRTHSNIKIFFFISIIILSIFLSACSKLKGEFAFKTLFDDTYRRLDRIPEFKEEEDVDWVYVFNDVRGSHRIGVALMKKEIVWVDINTSLVDINETKGIIYGEIQDLEEGRYKILLTGKDSILDEVEFIIFNEDEDS